MNSSATNLETGNDETTPAPAGHNVWRAIQKRFNVINHLMNTAVAFYMTYFCYGAGNAPVSWHAWLCTIGVSFHSNFGSNLILMTCFLVNFAVSVTDVRSYSVALFGKRLVDAV